jgi:hypothetical protein
MTKPHQVFPLIPSRLLLMMLSAEWPSIEQYLFINFTKNKSLYISLLCDG